MMMTKVLNRGRFAAFGAVRGLLLTYGAARG